MSSSCDLLVWRFWSAHQNVLVETFRVMFTCQVASRLSARRVRLAMDQGEAGFAGGRHTSAASCPRNAPCRRKSPTDSRVIRTRGRPAVFWRVLCGVWGAYPADHDNSGRGPHSLLAFAVCKDQFSVSAVGNLPMRPALPHKQKRAATRTGGYFPRTMRSERT